MNCFDRGVGLLNRFLVLDFFAKTMYKHQPRRMVTLKILNVVFVTLKHERQSDIEGENIESKKGVSP